MPPTPTAPSLYPGDEEASSLLERMQDFVSEHKKTILIGTAAAVVAAAGIAYLQYASASPRKDYEPSEGKRKKRTGAKGGKKKKQGNNLSGNERPILEEKGPVVTGPPQVDYDSLSAEQIFALPEADRVKVAASFKAKGNTAYQTKNFDEAVELYTKAIQVSPKPEPVFYSNRAACYVNMTPPKHELVVQDCDEAIKLDSKYVKALNRRAIALEQLERYQEALRDFTAATILDRFQNQGTAVAVERVLKALTSKRAKEIMQDREPRLPSFTFISAYFAAFRPREHPQLPESPSTGDDTLQLAFNALDAADYPHAVSFVNEAMEQGVSWDDGKAEAYNLRGTFKFLMGEVSGAKQDLEESLRIKADLIQSLVKLASVCMEQGDSQAAFECFDKAIASNPSDPDIYYHRGQVHFIMNDFEKAAENYTKSTELDDSFVFSHIQLAVAQYKMGDIQKSMAKFRRALTKFRDMSEPYNYYGELLLDQRRYQDAVEKFEEAIRLEKKYSNEKHDNGATSEDAAESVAKKKQAHRPNVLPYVNKGLALFQWKQDIAAAEECCRDALSVDPDCDAAVATLAQLSLQQNKLVEAAKLFESHTQLARTEPELMNALTYQYATLSQVEFQKNYPDMAEQLAEIAQSMMTMDR